MAVKSIIGSELEPSAVDGIVTDAKYIIDRLNGNKFQSQINSELIQRINKIELLLIGVTVSVEPKTLTFGQLSSVVISVTANTEADSVKIYRNGTEIYRDAVSGTEWEYTDAFTPDAVGEVIYKAVVVIDGSTIKENEASVTVQKVPTNIHWSADSCAATIGGTNTYPELLGTTGSMVIAYRSSDESVADINANGIVTLVSEGTCTITASFGGDETREGSMDSYTLTVSGEGYLAVQFGHGTSYNDAEWVTVGQLTNNLSVRNISNAYGEYLFIKYDKRDTVNNLWIDSDIPSSIDLDEPIVDGDYKYRRSEIRGAALAPIDYIINKV